MPEPQSHPYRRRNLVRILELRGPLEVAIYLAAIIAVVTAIIVSTQTNGNSIVFVISACLVMLLSRHGKQTKGSRLVVRGGG